MSDVAKVMVIDLPLLKENNAARIVAIAKAFDLHPLDREAQREAVLKLFNDKDEKSVFRGMVIPTLRKLGIIQGWEDMLYLSGSGKLIASAASSSDNAGKRALRAVLLEEDRRHIGLVEKILSSKKSVASIYASWAPKMSSLSQSQAEERIERWAALFVSAGLINKEDGVLSRNQAVVAAAKADLVLTPAKKNKFKEHLFAGYKTAVSEQRGVDVVDIAELRGVVSQRYWLREKLVVTESQFDAMLEAMPIVTPKYMLSFGKPMGAEEKVFALNGNYYRTMSIRQL